MATIASAKDKLRAKIPAMPGRYNRKIAAFLGVDASAVAASPPGKAYAAKVKPGMEDIWERELKAAYGIGG